MRGVRFHAGLLVAALVASLLTLTRDRPTGLERERPRVWNNDTTSVQALAYRSSDRDIDIVRRSFGDRVHLWGTEDDRTPPIIPPDADSARTAEIRAEAEQIREFPGGTPAADLFRGYASLRVVRDLGPLEEGERDRFGLGTPTATLSIRFDDGERELILGNPTPGGEDRYAWDATVGRAYVIPGNLVTPFENGEGALRERRVHAFPIGDVARVRIEANGRERTMLRTSDAEGGTWAPPDAPEQPDQAFANFMGRVAQLSIEGFRPVSRMGPMERLLRIDYLDASGESLGYVELHRSTAPSVGDTPTRYFLLSERLPVPADALFSQAERVHGDLPQLF